jgi:hypothetical protein
MIWTLLTEGDLNRGRAPELTSPHWRCGIVDPKASGAVCTLTYQQTKHAYDEYQALIARGVNPEEIEAALERFER